MTRRRRWYDNLPATPEQLADVPRLASLWPAVCQWAASCQDASPWAHAFTSSIAISLGKGGFVPTWHQAQHMQRIAREMQAASQADAPLPDQAADRGSVQSQGEETKNP